MMEVFNLADALLFARLEEGRGEHVALRFGERAWSYAEVAERTRRMAEVLHGAGLRCEERTLVVLPDLPAFVWTAFGVLEAGGVLTTASPYRPAADLADLLEYTRASVLVTVPSVSEALSDVITASPWLESVLLTAEVGTGEDPDAPLPQGALHREDDAPDYLWLTSALAAASGTYDPPPTSRDDPALWVFTSGRTGRPRAAVHTHGSVYFNVEHYARKTLGWRPEDVCVSVPRLYQWYAAASTLFFPFAAGGCAGLFSERPTPATVARAVRRYQATLLVNVPTMMARLLEHDETLRASGQPGLALSSLRVCLSAGEGLPAPLLEAWQRRFPGEVYDGLGSAELFHIYATNRPGDVRPGTVGRAVDGYDVRVLPRNAATPAGPDMPAGELGMIWVSGGSLASGFFRDREASLDTFHGRWCRTGDLGALEESGHLRILGREGTLLRVAGHWVNPGEVEECLLRHPGISEARVVGRDRGGLLTTEALVVARPDHTLAAQDVRTFAHERLAAHKVPKDISIVDSLPTNPGAAPPPGDRSVP